MGQLVFQANAGGQTALVGPNPSTSISINIPATNGNMVTTGDTGTVTSTMLASSVYTAPGTIGSGTPNTGAFTSLNATGANISGLTASSAIATDASKNLVSVTNTGTGNNVLATSPTLVTPNLGTPSAINLTNATALPYAALPAGNVLQVVNAITTTETSTTSTTYLDTSLTATITPKFSTSKILVLVNHVGVGKGGGDCRVKIRLQRDASSLATVENNGGYTGSSATNRVGSVSSCYLDSPATTSATTYKTQFGVQDGSGTVVVQADGCTSTITLMEIAA